MASLRSVLLVEFWSGLTIHSVLETFSQIEATVLAHTVNTILVVSDVMISCNMQYISVCLMIRSSFQNGGIRIAEIFTGESLKIQMPLKNPNDSVTTKYATIFPQVNGTASFYINVFCICYLTNDSGLAPPAACFTAFRFFFLENFKSSKEAWHTARTLYTRSCAVSSIVGHILGIGDRHTSNILVHTKTGEVVHIDFGIVFEQGKVGLDYTHLTKSIAQMSHYNLCLFFRH